MSEAAFFTLHRDLPREGPGDRASLDWALTVGHVPRDAKILDAGCGPGADIAGLLAHAPVGHVTALDTHPHFVERVRADWAGDGRVSGRLGDMAAVGGPYDLIWCAGALYFLGIEPGLSAWKRALAPGGVVAFSEMVWLVDEPEPGLKAAVEAGYAAIGGIEALKRKIAGAGYELCGMRVLSDAAWEAYWTPLLARAEALRDGADADLAAVLDEAEAEARLWRANRAALGYALTVVRPA